MSLLPRPLTLLWMLLLPGLAAAQLPTFELQRLHLETSGLGSLVVGTGRTLEPGGVRVSLQAHYEHLPLNFGRAWEPSVTTFGLVENKLTGHLTAAVGVLPWLQVGAQVPYILSQRGQSFQNISPPDGQGLNTPWVSVRAAPLQTRTGAPMNLAMELEAALPVGHAELLGRDTWALRPSLQGGLQGEDYQVGGEIAALLRPRNDLSPLTGRSQDVLGSELRLGATVTSRGANHTLTRPEVSVLLNVPLQGGRLSSEVLVGVRKHMPVQGLDVYFLGGPGLGTAVDEPSLRLLVGGAFTTGGMD